MTTTVVIGGGIMGAGIAFEARVAGFPVTIVDVSAEALEAAAERVGHYETRARDRGKRPGRSQGVASAEDLDTAMKLGWNHPMGPLELADRIGLDTILSICDDLREAWGDAFRAPPLLRQMVAAGKLGRKSGRGFYDYSA